MEEKIVKDIEFVKERLNYYESDEEWVDGFRVYEGYIEICREILDVLTEILNSKSFKMDKEKWAEVVTDAKQIGLNLTEYISEELENDSGVIIKSSNGSGTILKVASNEEMEQINEKQKIMSERAKKQKRLFDLMEESRKLDHEIRKLKEELEKDDNVKGE